MSYNLFDRVELLHDSVEVPELRAGAKGIVVDVLGTDGLMVEFPDETRPEYTIDVLSLRARDVRLIEAADEPSEPIAARA